MDRDMDADFAIDLDVPVSVIARPVVRRNPGSVAEMLAVLADRMSMEKPLTDAELAAKYPESTIDNDAEWDDRDDPAYFAWLED